MSRNSSAAIRCFHRGLESSASVNPDDYKWGPIAPQQQMAINAQFMHMSFLAFHQFPPIMGHLSHYHPGCIPPPWMQPAVHMVNNLGEITLICYACPEPVITHDLSEPHGLNRSKPNPSLSRFTTPFNPPTATKPPTIAMTQPVKTAETPKHMELNQDVFGMNKNINVYPSTSEDELEALMPLDVDDIRKLWQTDCNEVCIPM